MYILKTKKYYLHLNTKITVSHYIITFYVDFFSSVGVVPIFHLGIPNHILGYWLSY